MRRFTFPASSLLFVTALVLWAAPVQAAAIPSACLSLDDIDDKLISCDDNEHVAKAARDCAAAIKQRWEEASARLSAQLKKIGTGSNQRESQAKTQSALVATVAEVDGLIAMMQAQTDTVADYAPLMINFPDATSEEESPSCFTDNFRALDKTVWGMDEDLIRARAARAKAVAIAVAAGLRKTDFGKAAGVVAAPEQGRTAVAAPDNGPEQKRFESDISGTKENAPRGNAGPSAKLRGQEDAAVEGLFQGKLSRSK